MKLKFFLLFFSTLSLAFSQENYPIPTHPFLLFYIQHNKNKNTFVYHANVKNNALEKVNPINVYRINYEKDGKKDELTTLQKEFAYGITYLTSTKNQFVLSAQKKLPFKIKSVGKSYWVEVVINGKIIKVDRIFIQTEKNSSALKTKVEYILIYGRNQNDKSIVEKIVP